MSVNCYELLGVDKDASDKVIKKAYKRMALKWHPDRNAGSEEASKMFKEVSEAFEMLIDSKKQAIYDQVGEEGLNGEDTPLQGAGSPGGGNPSFHGRGETNFTFMPSPGRCDFDDVGFLPTDPKAIFEQTFGMGGLGGVEGMGGFSGEGGSRGRMSSMFTDEDDDMSGGHSFGGMPGKNSGSRSSTERTVNKRSAVATSWGRIEIIRPTAPSGPTELACPLQVSLEDLYTGTIKRLKYCRRFSNGGRDRGWLKFHVLPGLKAGTKMRFLRAGDELPSGQMQDIMLIVQEMPHDRFVREGNNLVYHAPLPLVDALAGNGGKHIVEALDGRKVQVEIPSGIIQPGTQTVVPGEGMLIRRKSMVREKGDLIVKWDIAFPDRLTLAQKESVPKSLA